MHEYVLMGRACAAFGLGVIALVATITGSVAYACSKPQSGADFMSGGYAAELHRNASRAKRNAVVSMLCITGIIALYAVPYVASKF